MIDRLLRTFSRFYGDERRAKRLRLDAEEVIDIAGAGARPERTRKIAERVARELSIAHRRGGPDPSRYGPIIEHFRTQHRQARQQRNDEALTALTLVIIYLRCEMLGEAAADARERIDAFLAERCETETENEPPTSKDIDGEPT